LTAGNTTSGLNTISTNIVKALRFPLPDDGLLEQFVHAREAVAELIASEARGPKQFASLSASLSAHAFSGQLTAEWREAHQDQLTAEADERDAALKEAGATITKPRRDPSEERAAALATDGIYADLNREQRDLFARIREHAGDGGGNGVRYFSAQSLGKLLDGPLRRNPHVIEGHLVVFAARGILIPVSREEQTEDTGEFVFGNAYRLPLCDHRSQEGEEVEVRIGDHSRLREMERLSAILAREDAQE